MSGHNSLGEYLRARRELVTPGSAGLPAGGLRRVAGLRREEVAMLAGISAEYYLRLEQGRDRKPSRQVLQALARVLDLDQAGAAYLVELAATPPASRRRAPRRETVPTSTRQLLDRIGLPAFVESRWFDVLAANDLARALSPNLRVGRNRLRAVFLDPTERALYPDWERATARLVAGFRSSVGTDVEDTRVVQLVGELSLSSDRFRRLWARQDVQIREGMPERLRHPEVGDLTLSREKLAINGTDGQLLVLYHAEPGTTSGDGLVLLAALSRPCAARHERTLDDQPGPRPVDPDGRRA